MADSIQTDSLNDEQDLEPAIADGDDSNIDPDSQTKDDLDMNDKNEPETDHGAHVDEYMGASANALQHSLLMFGDPNEHGNTRTKDTKADSEEEAGNSSKPEKDEVNSDSFIPEEERDVTQHNDSFNLDVHIRLIKPEDEVVVRKLIYDNIYVFAIHRMLLNATERPFVITMIGLSAVIFTWLFGSVVLGLLLSVLGLPLLIYGYIQLVILPSCRRRYLPEISQGVYSYWSASDHGRVMWVAEVENKVAGCVAVETHSAVAAELRHISVLPEWQCLGLGGNLAAHALSHVRRRRFNKLHAHVLSCHSEALNMHDKLGFRRTGVRRAWGGMATVHDFTINLSTGSRAEPAENLQAEEQQANDE